MMYKKLLIACAILIGIANSNVFAQANENDEPTLRLPENPEAGTAKQSIIELSPTEAFKEMYE